MRIGLFGYGKMGQLIGKLATDQGHEIVARIDTNSELAPYSSMDVAIDFSTPAAAFDIVKGCLENGVPVISGTTGWLDKKPEIEAICKNNNGAFLYASNFSLGVNLFFKLNRDLANMMDKHSNYRVRLHEIHHENKLDSPSGTAIRLAHDIADNSRYSGWSMDSKDPKMIPVTSSREGQAPGTHEILWESADDAIQITHTAHSRMGFAAGAILASEWIIGKTGLFSMQDVLEDT
ncbi:MAG: 4-hydroxy-tetrahydrodipicolinate reductase [Bacteroidia bacterium]|nr:4-hydroxy-tetrahydrodipicolinate reductase [Bacteroidia bacterium]